MKQIEKTGFIITKHGGIMGKVDKTRLKSLPWFKRLYARLDKSYRNKYIDIRPFKIKENSTS